jgi:hypothetical protein
VRVNESQGFTFLCAELGAHSVGPYLAGLPPIDLLYCAPPNPDWMPWWRRKAGVEGSGDYAIFIESWLEVVLQVDARECHLELGTCRPMVEAALDRRYPHKYEQPCRYAAPSTGRGMGMCRTRTARFSRLSYRRDGPRPPLEESSDAFLNARLKDSPKLICFDPCIGKGLLSRTAIDYGHECHGIDINAARLEAASLYVEDQCRKLSRP